MDEKKLNVCLTHKVESQQFNCRKKPKNNRSMHLFFFFFYLYFFFRKATVKSWNQSSQRSQNKNRRERVALRLFSLVSVWSYTETTERSLNVGRVEQVQLTFRFGADLGIILIWIWIWTMNGSVLRWKTDPGWKTPDFSSQCVDCCKRGTKWKKDGFSLHFVLISSADTKSWLNIFLANTNRWCHVDAETDNKIRLPEEKLNRV